MVITETSVPLFLLPPGMLAAIIAGACAAMAAVAWLVVHRLLRLPPTRAPHAPFHIGLVALFSLFLSFTAGEAWRRGDTAYAALLREAGGVQALLQFTDALGSPAVQPVAGDLRAAMRDYLDASLREEWATGNVAPSSAAGLALHRARDVTLRALLRAGAESGAWRVAYDRLEDVQQARSARLVAGGLYGDALRWGGLLALYCAGALAIALVHLDRRPGVGPALILYVVAAAAALSLVAAFEHPYTGWDATRPDRLVQIRAAMDGAN